MLTTLFQNKPVTVAATAMKPAPQQPPEDCYTTRKWSAWVRSGGGQSAMGSMFAERDRIRAMVTETHGGSLPGGGRW